MIRELPSSKREPKLEELSTDLVVVGGGLAGVCCAITAAREGVRVVLIQDRPVLGGNASSEVRLWVLGATSHMGNNNRWSREGGVINEVLEENLYRNRQGNPVILDTILLEKCVEEENLILLLNTAVFDLEKEDADTISAVYAFCSQNSTKYLVKAPLFCDASGDGMVGFLSGAAFRMGAESTEEFGEKFAPDSSYGELLGHSMYFYTKDVGTPVSYKAPSWALKDITEIPHYRKFNTNMQGCNFWWLEYGGRLDTIHETETIKWELWKVIYGVWDHIKNSGDFPEAETLTLEWVGHIPGKRESRRFEGDYLMKQQDVVEQTVFDDVVSHGGWAVDLHPADGVYSDQASCTQWHSKGVYGIPYRSYYSRNINNLFLAGRIISASHVAFGSTRVMATCAAGGQAVGMAAALCMEKSQLPAELGEYVDELQCRLVRAGQFLPDFIDADPADLARLAKVTATSESVLSQLKPNKAWVRLDAGWAMLIPLEEGVKPTFGFEINAEQSGALRIELRRAGRKGNFSPDELVEALEVPFEEGQSQISASFFKPVAREGYHFVTLGEDPAVRVRVSDERMTGVLSLSNAYNKAVATSARQEPPKEIGIDSFEFWLPKRRPEGRNLAMTVKPPVSMFGAENTTSGPSRPTEKPNAWVASKSDESPELTLTWDAKVSIGRIILEFDPDWDHPMESVLMTHSEEVVPFLVRDFEIVDDKYSVIHRVCGNHCGRYVWQPEIPIYTDRIALRILATHGTAASVFRIRCFKSC